MPCSEPAPTAVDETFLAALGRLVAIPSVSRDGDPVALRDAAEFLAGQLSFAGGHLEPTAGNPVVRADWLGAPDAPTVLVYGHYDVQPTGDPADWHSPPFELTVDGEVLRGRGVTDDKGPVLLVLTLARRLLERDGRLPLNVKFLLEGEEEIGSPNLAGFVRDHAGELAADLVVSADGAAWRPDVVSVPVGSKGLLGMELEVRGADRDLHSGRYGGIVANPAHGLAALLAGLHAPDGSIAVAGFHDGVGVLSDQRRREIAAVPFDEAAFLGGVGLSGGWGEPGLSTLERLWERPTLEVNGILAGGPYTVIPRVASAHLSCRLVPGQDPAAVLSVIRDHLAARPADGLTVALRAEPNAVPAYTIPGDHPAVAAARAALQSVYPGADVVLDVIAGTLPATTLFEQVLGVKTLFFSFSTSDENLHGPDEFLRIARIGEGMRAWEQLWRLLADGPHRLARQTNEHRTDEYRTDEYRTGGRGPDG